MAGGMRLIGLDRENRRGQARGNSFAQAALGAACAVLLLALPLWALESVNDIAIDAVTHQHAMDQARPAWHGPGAAASGQSPAGQQAMEPSEEEPAVSVPAREDAP